MKTFAETGESRQFGKSFHFASVNEPPTPRLIHSDSRTICDVDHARSRHVAQRAREVLGLLALGQTNCEIAARLHVSPHTVRNHLSRIFAKLGAGNRTAAVRAAYRLGHVTL